MTTKKQDFKEQILAYMSQTPQALSTNGLYEGDAVVSGISKSYFQVCLNELVAEGKLEHIQQLREHYYMHIKYVR